MHAQHTEPAVDPLIIFVSAKMAGAVLIAVRIAWRGGEGEKEGEKGSQTS